MSVKATPVRVLMVKWMIDGHDRGVKTVVQAMRDAGFEVVYGQYLAPQEVVKMAAEEDVDVIGLSCALGHHTAHSAEILMGLKEIGKKDTPVIVGGNFPSDDIPEMLQVGVSAVFEPGTLTTDIIEWVKGVLKT